MLIFHTMLSQHAPTCSSRLPHAYTHLLSRRPESVQPSRPHVLGLFDTPKRGLPRCALSPPFATSPAAPNTLRMLPRLRTLTCPHVISCSVPSAKIYLVFSPFVHASSLCRFTSSNNALTPATTTTNSSASVLPHPLYGLICGIHARTAITRKYR